MTNEVIHSIYLINKELEGNKKGQTRNKSDLSCQVGVAGLAVADPNDDELQRN